MGTEPLTIETCPPLMTVVELAKVLRVGKNTAYSLVSKRIIPSVKIGRQLRIYREDVVAFLRSSKSKTIRCVKLSDGHMRFRYTPKASDTRPATQKDCQTS